MTTVTDIRETTYTVEDLLALLGPMPLARVRFDRPPGTATEEDVIEIHDRENRLCELVEGVLVEKTVGAYESYLAALMVRILGNFVEQHRLGIVYGPDGMARLATGLIRIPDVAFFSWDRFPSRKLPRGAFVQLAPDLAVEVISPSNTRREMDRKLTEYFKSGAKAVWCVDPTPKTVRVYSSPEQSVELTEAESLDGGALLPGFKLSLGEFFAEPDSAANP